MLEFWITFLLFIGLLLVYSALAFLLEGESLCLVLLVLGGILWYYAFALSTDYFPPDDLEIPRTCRQVLIQTSQSGVNFIELDSKFINLNDKFGRSFENDETIWIQETLPVEFTSFYGYKRSTKGSFEILLQKPVMEVGK